MKESYDQHVMLCMKHIMELASVYEVSLKKRDDEICRAYVMLVDTLAINQVHVFSHANQLTHKFIELIIYCGNHPDKKIAQLTFGFWYYLQQQVDKQRQNDKFKQIFAQALPIMIRLCDLASFKDYDEEDVFEFRELVADALVGPFNILFADYFGICQQLLSQCLPKEHWSLVESILFAITSVAQATGGKHLEKLKPILEMFPKIKSEDMQLKTTMIDILGAYSQHITNLDQNFTVWCLNFTLTCVWSLKKPHHVNECSRNFVEFCEHLKSKSITLEVATNLIKGCLENLDKLSPEIGVNVFKGISHIIVIHEDPNDQKTLLRPILGFLAKRINVLTNPTQQNVPHLTNHLGLVKALLFAFDGEKPQLALTSILTDFYPLMEPIFKNYKTQEEVINEACSLEIAMILSIGSRKESFEIFGKMLNLAYSFYEYYQYPTVLKLIMTLIGGEKNALSLNHFKMICSKTFSNKNLLDNADLLGYFYKLMIRVVDTYPMYLKSEMTEKIFELGIICVDYQKSADFELCLTLVKFFKKILTCNAFEKEYFSRMILMFSGKLIETTLMGILENESKNTHALIQVIELYVKIPQLLKSFSINFLMNPNTKCFKLSDTQKSTFVTNLQKCHGFNGVKREMDTMVTILKSLQ